MALMSDQADTKGFFIRNEKTEEEFEFNHKKRKDSRESEKILLQDTQRLKKAIDLERLKNNELQDQLKAKEKMIEGLKKKLYLAEQQSENLYEVKEGDCLWRIAKKKNIYNDPMKWIKIYNANMDRIDHPDELFPGQLLRIPA